MKTPPRLLTLAGGLLAVTFLASPALQAGDTVRIDGSSTVYPITKAAADAYMKETGGKTQVDVSFSGSSAGFRKFVKGELDIADASRPILKKEIEEAKANGIKFIEIPVAFDALTVAVHPEMEWLNSIKVSELKKIWHPDAEGKITKWNQVNPDWPDQTIVLWGAGGDSGTYDYFAEVITGGKKLRSDFNGSEDDTEIVEGVATSPGALGFLPYSYLVGSDSKLKALGVANDANVKPGTGQQAHPIQPTNKAVYEGIYEPLGRPLFIYVNAKSLEENPAVGEFLGFFLKNAPTFIHQSHYLPLSEIAYRKAQKDLNNRVTGTRFDGSPVTGISHHSIFTLKPKE